MMNAKDLYLEYLESDAWKGKRELVLTFWNHSCAICNSSGELHIHHRTYKRTGDEKLSDLIPLCADCHARHHDKLPSQVEVNNG